MNKLEILQQMEDPRQLEQLYRENKSEFKTAFRSLYPRMQGKLLAEFWNERLNYGDSPSVSWGSARELTLVIIMSLMAGLIAKLPAFLHLDPEYFYQRNIGFIVFPILAIYFIWKQGISTGKLAAVALAFLVAIVFINLLPGGAQSNTVLLSCIHLPLFLWAVLGYSYLGNEARSYSKRLDFLRYNGDLVIMTTLLGIAGAILTGITIGLFSVIGFNIEQFYFEYIGIFGLAALPIVATYITQTNPHLVNRVSPVIAKIFSPLVLITMVIYLVAIFFSGKDPYTDRDFLLLFNFLLIGVMAIILFSIAETARQRESRAAAYILFALALVTIVVNGIALSAILFRISEWGITPNRLAVLGANILMLLNLCMVSLGLYKHIFKSSGIEKVEHAIAMFLPVYVVWTIIVIFIFPFIFQFQ